ncbi:MAG: HD domain-containing protein [Acetatifactor sp.]|nr:HD domain-containing protein [Acetatifactor sp.]
MRFIRTEDLKTGMRLARPIYSKKGVLLFDRNSKLSSMAIESVHNFGLLGIYILEPAEPLPPMTDEDREFERFQTMAIFSIQDELNKILAGQKQNKIQMISNTIIKNYGHQDDRINFYQNLRGRDDFVYRHSLNVAVLCALICHVMNVRLEDQLQTVHAAIIHDIGKMSLKGDIIYRDDCDEQEKAKLYNAQVQAGDLMESAFPNGTTIKRICAQAARQQYSPDKTDASKMVIGAKILLVANRYDELTAMSLGGDTKSEIQAIRELMGHPEIYDREVVNALINSINIVFPGVSVELSTGEKALVLAENRKDILRPLVLSFRDNSIIDLGIQTNNDISILDIMKTMDNRYIMNNDVLKTAGYAL